MATIKDDKLTLEIQITSEKSGDPDWVSYSVLFLCNSKPLFDADSINPHWQGTAPGSFLADAYKPDLPMYAAILNALASNSSTWWECGDANFRIVVLPFISIEELSATWRAAMDTQRMADWEREMLQGIRSMLDQQKPDDTFLFLAQLDTATLVGEPVITRSGPSLILDVTRMELEAFANALAAEYNSFLAGGSQ